MGVENNRGRGQTRRELLRMGTAGLVAAGFTTGCDLLSTDPNSGGGGGGRAGKKGREAPSLAKLVKAGDLPPVAKRLPKEPLVVRPADQIGAYGGTWNTALLGPADAAWLDRTIGYDNLTRWDPEFSKVIPNVAKSVEPNADGREYTITLRAGMRWSDGEPFTADDLVFANEEVERNEKLTPVPPDNPATFEKIDDVTVRVTFERPNGLFPEEQAQAGGSDLVSRPFHYLKQFHEKYNPDIDALVEEEGVADWVELFNRKGALIEGTPYNARWMNPDLPTLCPWHVDNALGDGSRLVASRNPYYWKTDPDGSQLPYIDEVRFQVITDPEVMLLRASNGDFDMHARHINEPRNKPVLARNRESGGYDFFDTVPASMNNLMIAFNLTHPDRMKREIFQNKDFRIGLSYAINREELITAVFQGQGKPWQAAPSERSEFYVEELATQYVDYDVDLANQHLDKAGYSERDGENRRLGPDGEPIQFDVETATGLSPTQVDALELIRGYWTEVGITMRIKAEDRALFYTRKEANKHDVAIWGGDGGLNDAILDPRWYFPFSQESNYAIAWANWYNGDSPAMKPPATTRRQMELYDQLKASPDPAERRELFMQILQIATDEFYAIGTILPAQGYGIVKTTFHNVPKTMPNAYVYPTPGPTNPEQYYTDA
ncbi:ABC transporter substrate-binding protein [Actinopolymorpha sp. B11F2]|uniref:ABC transporter substrate-binding protein n=1 Tax=Actinopolymorpha sp. B11F2 TaxID=3160862 RepID=UPI0032E4DA84